MDQSKQFQAILGRAVRQLKAKPDLLRCYNWEHPDRLNVPGINAAAKAEGLGPVFEIGEARDWATWPNLPDDDPQDQHKVECLTVFHPDDEPYKIRRWRGELDDGSAFSTMETIARLEAWERAAQNKPDGNPPTGAKSKRSTERGEGRGDELATGRLLSVFTNGLADERLGKAVNVLENDTLTVDEKLWKIDALMPIPPTVSAANLGKALGVSKTAIQNTTWYAQKRKGQKDNEIGRRHEQHRQRGQRYESDRTTDDDD